MSTRLPAFVFFAGFICAASLTGCPDPDPWVAEPCYCDDNGCVDSYGDVCEGQLPASSSSSSGEPNASSSSSGEPSASSSSSSGEPTASSSSSGEPSASSSSSGTPGTSSSSGEPSASSSSSGAPQPQPNCSSDAQCSANQRCVAGFCRYQCLNDNDCRLIDNRFVCSAERLCSLP